MANKERSSETPGIHSPETTGAPTRTAGALGLAVLARMDDVTQKVVDRWELSRRSTGSDEDDAVRTDVERFTSEGTEQICRFLVSGELSEAGGSAATAGWHVANRSSTLADLLKVFLIWRDGLTAAFRDEAARLGSEPDALSLAEMAVCAGTDASLVQVARRCDEYRGLLQSQLGEEQTRLTHQALHDALTGLPNRVLSSTRPNMRSNAGLANSIRPWRSSRTTPSRMVSKINA